jgi:acetyl esterase/lipase
MTKLTRRDFTFIGSTASAATAFTGKASAVGASPRARRATSDPMDFVDRELREPLRSMQKMLDGFTLNYQTLVEQRAKADKAVKSYLPTPAVTERLIPGPKGAPDVRLFIVNGMPADQHRPAILYIHGGGYVGGKAADDIPSLQKLALDHGCAVISVEYRLAPETPFPGALEDNYAALKWLYANAQALGIARNRIVVMGESAGGGHAAMLSTAARDRGEVPVFFQLLVFPMLDDRTGSTRPVPPHIGAFIWKPEFNRFGWSSLLGVRAGSRTVPQGSVPARVADLTGLPPTFIGVGSIDLFVGEDIEYASRLIEAGVPTELNVVPGAYHGFQVFAPEATVSKQFKASISAALTKAFKDSDGVSDGD